MSPKTAHRLILATICLLTACAVAAVFLPLVAHAQTAVEAAQASGAAATAGASGAASTSQALKTAVTAVTAATAAAAPATAAAETAQTTPATTAAAESVQATPATTAAAETAQTTPVTSAAAETAQATPVTSAAAETAQTTPATSAAAETAQTTPVTTAAAETAQTTPATTTAAISQTTPATTTGASVQTIPAPTAQPAPPVPAAPPVLAGGPQAADMAVQHMKMTVGMSQIVESPVKMQRAAVALPEVIEFVAVSPTELLINGKKEGETSLILWAQGGGRVMFDITVLPNPNKVDAVRHQLKDELAGQDVDLVFENNTPFLRGTVRDLTSAERAVAIAMTLGKPVNLLRVTTPPPQTQVLLKVRFCDVDRQFAGQYGINFFRNGSGATGAAVSTSQFTPTAGGGSGVGQNSFSLGNAVNIFLYNKSIDLGAIINFLETKNMLQILAEPNLMTIDGKPASFLNGGQFPYPTVSASGTGGVPQVSIAFQNFGISLNFVPHITSRGTIRLEVAPEVSSLDYADGISYQGFNVPALSTKRVQTEVEIESGQSFVIGGLLDNQVTETLSKVPGLSSIPLFGKLFESRQVTKNKTELLVLVTAEIVRPIPADQPAPSIGFPSPFMHEGGDSLPRTPGMDKTGPVPVIPPSPTIAVETLMEEKKRDQKSNTTPPQLQLLGVPINPAPGDTSQPASGGGAPGYPGGAPTSSPSAGATGK